MRLTFRVQNHEFASEGKTRLHFTGIEGTEGSLQTTVSNAQASKYPVGATVAVTVAADSK